MQSNSHWNWKMLLNAFAVSLVKQSNIHFHQDYSNTSATRHWEHRLPSRLCETPAYPSPPQLWRPLRASSQQTREKAGREREQVMSGSTGGAHRKNKTLSSCAPYRINRKTALLRSCQFEMNSNQANICSQITGPPLYTVYKTVRLCPLVKKKKVYLVIFHLNYSHKSHL